jgi:hypothetical protein
MNRASGGHLPRGLARRIARSSLNRLSGPGLCLRIQSSGPAISPGYPTAALPKPASTFLPLLPRFSSTHRPGRQCLTAIRLPNFPLLPPLTVSIPRRAHRTGSGSRRSSFLATGSRAVLQAAFGVRCRCRWQPLDLAHLSFAAPHTQLRPLDRQRQRHRLRLLGIVHRQQATALT